MNTFKAIIISLLIIVLMTLLSVDVTDSPAKVQNLYFIVLGAFVFLMYILSKYSNLFKFNTPKK